MEEVEGIIQELLNGDVDVNSILNSSLFYKIASSINGLVDAFTNIECESFTSNTIWTTPPNEICWLVAIGVGGGGGGGGGAPILFSGGAVAGDSGSPGGNGGNTTFNGTVVGYGGAGGIGGELGAATGRFTHPVCKRNLYTLKSNVNLVAGRGAYVTNKAYQRQDASDSEGAGGFIGEYGVQIFKDLSPNTGYPIVIGQGGAAGANHPLLNGQLGTRTLYNATAGGPGEMMIIYSGY